jgi:hypothetical protein
MEVVTLWPSAGRRLPRTTAVAPDSAAPLASFTAPATEPVISAAPASGATGREKSMAASASRRAPRPISSVTA